MAKVLLNVVNDFDKKDALQGPKNNKITKTFNLRVHIETNPSMR